MRGLAPLLLLTAVVVAAPGAAQAQGAAGPRYVESQPAPQEFLHTAPSGVSITFSEPLGDGSTMSVSDECGRRIDDGRVALDDNEMQVGIALRPSGDYTVSYVAEGAEDGSGTVPGSFGFRVHLGPDCDGGGGGDHHHGDGDGGDRGEGDDDGGHGDHDPSATEPHQADHSDSSDHTMAVHSSGEHGSDGAGHTDQGKGRRHRVRDHSHKKGSGNEPGGQDGDLALPGTSASVPEPVREATGADVALALGLAGGFGALGGLILRSSRER